MSWSLLSHTLARLGCAALLLLCVVALPGCGSSRQKAVYVAGKVTYGGGNWPGKGTIYFNPTQAAPGYTMRGGTGNFGPDGNFVAQSFEDMPGLAPGSYVVNIECWEVPPSMENPGKEKSYVPKEYQPGGAKAFTLEVKPDDAAKNLTYDIPKQ